MPRGIPAVKSEVSAKSTKQEIMEAYQEALRQIEDSKSQDPRKEAKAKESAVVVNAASERTVETVIADVSQLKVTMTQALDQLSGKLLEEVQRFQSLQKAIEIQQAQLAAMYEIQVQGDSLAALILAQKEKAAAYAISWETQKAALDQEIAQTREAWEKEKVAKAQAQKEEQEMRLKDRKREEEEYQYTLKLTRAKDKDQYEMQKAVLERELQEKRDQAERDFAQRETLLVSREEELRNLREQVAAFPEKLEGVIRDTETRVSEKLTFQYQFKTELQEKDLEGERRLSEQRITALQEKIKEQEHYIRHLLQKTDDSTQHVQTIAIKAIEGAQGMTLRGLGAVVTDQESQKTGNRV